MFRLRIHAATAVLGLSFLVPPVFGQAGGGAGGAGGGAGTSAGAGAGNGTGSGTPGFGAPAGLGTAPGAMPGAARNGSQPGGSGSGVGPGLSGYSPSYGIPGSGGYGYNSGTGLSGGGAAGAYRVPGASGNGAYGATGLGTNGLYGTGGGSGIGNALLGVTGRNAARSGGNGGMGGTNARLDSDQPPPLASPDDENIAHVRVIVPKGDAQLWVNDSRTQKKGTNRKFISPILTPGKNFIYDLRVRYTDGSGKTIEQNRSIRVRAGAQQIVDFTQPEGSHRAAFRDGGERRDRE